MTEMLLAVRITADGRAFVGQMDAAQAKTAGLKTALGQTANEARDLARASDATAAAQGRAAGAATRLAASEVEVAAAARLAATAQAQAGAASVGATGAVARQSRGMDGLGLALGGAAAALSVAVTRSLDLGTSLIATSRQLGISVTAVQQFRHAARVTGVDVGALESSIGKLTLKIGQATAGNREANNAFAALRVGFETTDGAARSTENVLRDVFATLAAIEDPAARARLGTALLGDEYQRISPLLGDGAAGLAQFTAALEEQNRHLTPAQVAVLAAANIEYEKMQQTLGVSIAATVAENTAGLHALANALGAVANLSIRAASAWGEFWSNVTPGQLGLIAASGPLAQITLGAVTRHNANAAQDAAASRAAFANLTPQRGGNILFNTRAPSAPFIPGDRNSLLINPAARRATEQAEFVADVRRYQRAVVAPSPPTASSRAHPAAAAGVAVPHVIGPRGRNRGGGGGNRSAEAAARRAEAALERQRNLAEQVGVSIGRINDRWNEQPRLINQAAQDSEDLDRIITDLTEKKPPNWQALVDQAREAQGVIQTGLLRPFNDLVRASQRQVELQSLVLGGREDEAEVLDRIYRLQDAGVTVSEGQRSVIEQIVAREREVNDLLENRDAIIGAYQRSIGDLRGSLESLLSGGSVREFGRNLIDNARHLRGELLTEQLFGQPLRELEREIRESTGLEGTISALDTQVTTTVTAFAAVENAATSLSTVLADAANPGAAGAVGSFAADGGAFGDPTGDLGAVAASLRDIIVTGSRQGSSSAAASISAMRPNDYFTRVAAVMTRPITQLLEQIDATMGTKLADKVGGAIQGGLAGYFSAGPVGGVLGALNGSGLVTGKAGKVLGQASAGAQKGAEIAQIGKQLGIKTSTTGGSLGGAIGAATGVPGGDIVGSIIGSVVGGLLKKSKKGVATITNVTGDAVLSGNNKAFKAQAGEAASSVQSAIQSIADQLGGSVGNFAVSLGVKDGKYYLDPTGKGQTKKKKGAIGYGEDGTAAVSAAIIDAISDGGVTGISAAMQKALKSSSDLDKALKEALKVRDVEDIIGGIGSTLERQFRAFEGQAKDRVRIATQYGFDVVAIEARNAEDRKKLVDQILDDRVGSLRELLKDFAFGDLFEGSASDRRTALLGEAAKAKVDAEAGKDGAAAKLADLLRQLAETSRDAYGTAGPEFAADRSGAISSAEKVIALENERIKAGQDAAVATKAAIDTNNALTNESNDLLAQVVAKLEGLSGLGAVQVQAALSASNVSRQVAL